MVHTSTTYKLLQELSLISERILSIDSYRDRDKLDYTIDALGMILKGAMKSLSGFFSQISYKVPDIKIGKSNERIIGLEAKLSNLVRIVSGTFEMFGSLVNYDFETQKKLQTITIEYREIEEQVGLMKQVLSQFNPNTLTGPVYLTVKKELKIKTEVIYMIVLKLGERQ